MTAGENQNEGARAFEVLRLDHVQVTMPPGREEAGEAFYAGLLGFEIVPKPAALAVDGGRWFVSGPAQIHLGGDPDFHPAVKGHPALIVQGLASLAARLEAAGHPVKWDTRQGDQRCFVLDPFGNRVELIGV